MGLTSSKSRMVSQSLQIIGQNNGHRWGIILRETHDLYSGPVRMAFAAGRVLARFARSRRFSRQSGIVQYPKATLVNDMYCSSQDSFSLIDPAIVAQCWKGESEEGGVLTLHARKSGVTLTL